MPKPQATDRRTIAEILDAARRAGWARAKVEWKPDGSVTVDAGMTEADTDDDFLSSDLRMGK